MVVVNCGVTHNFISVTLVSELQLVKSLTTSYVIVVGIGKEVRS